MILPEIQQLARQILQLLLHLLLHLGRLAGIGGMSRVGSHVQAVIPQRFRR